MSAATPSIDWSKAEQTGLVSIGTHQICLSSYGPDRKPGSPVVICIPGLASSSKGWAAVVRLLKPHIRSYTYDRSGFGGSDLSPSPPSSTNIANELSLLLQCAKIAPPYIFIAHSWGGILVREFLHLQSDPGSISSLVLLDTNHDDMVKLIDWRHPALWAMAADLDLLKLPAFFPAHGLRPSEWDAYQADIMSVKHNQQAEKERLQYTESFSIIAKKGQLRREKPLMGDSPVAIIAAQPHVGFQEMFDAGMAHGNGTVEERSTAAELLSTWKETHERLQQELQTLSKRSQYKLLDCGHDIHVVKPEAVVEAVIWVLSHQT